MNRMNAIRLTAILALLVCTVAAQAQRKNARYVEYIEKYAPLAVQQMKEHKIPASITLAQGLLESGAGQSALARKSNNHFGIKCGSNWRGRTVRHDDDARNECFRAYSNPRDSYEDHSAFLKRGARYAFLFDLKVTDYKGWARGLKKAGYATDPSYANRLITIIEDYELYKYDSRGMSNRENRNWEKELKKKPWLANPHQVYIANDIAYVVARDGDTFRFLGKEFDISWKKLVKYNDLHKDYTLEEIDQNIVPLIEDAVGDKNVQVQKVQDSNQVIFKTQTLNLEKREAFNKVMADNFGVAENEIATENISSTVSSEMRRDAIVAVIIATICMLLYIWFRFKDVRFATSAVLALLHDVLIVLGFYAIARVSVGNTFIACMLTIVGYSINATIVIFDRIREELKTKKRGTQLDELVNKCITLTLTRSVYTSLTTFVMVAVLYIMGVSSIREFALPLMVGIICGAYSSVCITGALWYVMKTKIGVKKAGRK